MTLRTLTVERMQEVRSTADGAICLFLVGDFYEAIDDDACKVAQAIGLTITTRRWKGRPDRLMCGFPHHSLESYLVKLIKAGLRVAVCEQVDDPNNVKGIPKRENVQTLFPA